MIGALLILATCLVVLEDSHLSRMPFSLPGSAYASKNFISEREYSDYDQYDRRRDCQQSYCMQLEQVGHAKENCTTAPRECSYMH